MYVKNLNRNNSSAGFTLLELSIVTVISILLTMALIKFLDGYKAQQDHESAKRAMVNAKTAIAKFYELDGRYPCPARKDLNPGDANYGKEDCSIAAIAGARDTNGDGANDPVMIGMLPMKATVTPLPDPVSGTTPPPYEVSLPELIEDNEILNTNITDAWGNVLQYAVTSLLTKRYDKDDADDTFDPYRGAIQVTDENGKDTGGSKQDVHFVIVSAGHDEMGAKNWATGTQTACNNDYAMQKTNCETSSAVFVSGLRNTAADNANFYDDYIAFATTVPMTLWSKDATNGVSTVTSGSVGIGTATPADDVKLEIGNTAAAMATGATNDVKDNSTLKVDRSTFSETICDAENPTSKCFSPQSLMDISCTGPGQYMRSVNISGSALQSNCETISLARDSICPEGGFLRGLNSDGTIECIAPLPVRLETAWIGLDHTHEKEPTIKNSQCAAIGTAGWTTTEITDNYDKSDDPTNPTKYDPLHSLSEKTDSQATKKTQLCMRTTDAKVVLTSTWATGSCPSGFRDTGVRDGSDSAIHNLTEKDVAANNALRWCLKAVGKGYSLSTRWVSGAKKYPECKVDGTSSDEIAIMHARNGDKNLNANTLSGSYETLCAKLVRQ